MIAAAQPFDARAFQIHLSGVSFFACLPVQQKQLARLLSIYEKAVAGRATTNTRDTIPLTVDPKNLMRERLPKKAGINEKEAEWPSPPRLSGLQRGTRLFTGPAG
jgi:hypothetical protein